MTPDIVAVLVVPFEGDPCGLLVRGRCGGPPAMVAWWGPSGVNWGRLEWYVSDTRGDRVALPLSWDGELVPEGWDRARRVALERTFDTGRSAGPRRIGSNGWPTLAEVESFAEWMVLEALAERVVRLARVDGRLVELEPVGVGT